MKTWDDWSDKDVNKAVEKITGMYCEDVDGRYVQTCDYCNNWSDIGPIIVDYGICLTSPTKGRKTANWSASWNEDGGRWSSGDIVFGDKNPLRAAAIVFLEMNGVKP